MPSFVENVNSLATSLTETNVNNIGIVVGNQQNIDTVASNITSVNTTALDISSVNTVAGSIANVNTVGNSIDSVNALAPVVTDMDLLSPQAANIEVVADNITSVVTTATNIDDVNIVAADIGQVAFDAIEDLGLITEPVTSNPSTGTSFIKTVADNIVPVTATGTNITSVVTTADNIASVNTVAANISDVASVATTVVPNIVEILQVNDNAALVVDLLDQFDDRYLGGKAVAPTLDNDGNVLQVGALYFDTVLNRIRVWDGLLWSDALELTAGSISTLSNKTIDHISNVVGANHIHYPVRNITSSTIPAGTVVHAYATQPGTDYITIEPIHDPSTEIALGITHSDIPSNGTGLVMNTGVCADTVDTSGWAVGTILYPNTTGGLTSTKPTTGRYQACAVVLRSHQTQGTMLVEFTEPRDTPAKILTDILASGIPIDMGSIV